MLGSVGHDTNLFPEIPKTEAGDNWRHWGSREQELALEWVLVTMVYSGGDLRLGKEHLWPQGGKKTPKPKLT